MVKILVLAKKFIPVWFKDSPMIKLVTLNGNGDKWKKNFKFQEQQFLFLFFCVLNALKARVYKLG